MTEMVTIGDKIRLSVELLEEIRALPNHHTEICTVVKITEDEEGVKRIWLQRA